MSRRLRCCLPLVALALSGGCRSRQPAAEQGGSPVVASTGPVLTLAPPVADAGSPADPVALLRQRFPAAKNIRWPTQWTPDLVVAVAGDDDDVSLIWADRTRPARDGGSSDDTMWLDGKPTGLASIDLDGDGVNDLVVWLAVPVSEAGPAHQEVVTLRGSSEPRSAFGRNRIALLLKDTKGPDDVLPLVPHLREYLPPERAGSTESLVVRIDLATDAQLRALIAPSGISICDSAEGNAIPHHHTCKRFVGARITKSVLDSIVETTGTFSDWQEPPDPPQRPERAGQTVLPNGVECKPAGTGKRGARTVCIAQLGGPAYSVWTFEGLGAERRLVEVDSVAYESS